MKKLKKNRKPKKESKIIILNYFNKHNNFFHNIHMKIFHNNNNIHMMIIKK